MDPDPIAEALSAYLSAADAYSDFTFPFLAEVGGDRGRQIHALHAELEQARSDYLALLEPAEPTTEETLPAE
jgi:hypothetical protein